MSDLDFQIREIRPDDVEPVQKIYQRFTKLHAGPLARKPTFFRRVTKTKNQLRWVALDVEGKIAGYILSTYNESKRRGRIDELVVDPDYDFITVANPLVDKLHNVFIEKGAASIHAATIRNPHYSEIFGKLGFLEVETDAVFMIAIHDVPKFLSETVPIFTERLAKLHSWDGWLHLCCEQSSRFFRKDGENVQQLVWTNREVDLKISLEVQTLVDLLLGVLTFHRALEEKRMLVETTLSKDKAEELLRTIFPETQFLAFNFW